MIAQKSIISAMKKSPDKPQPSRSDAEAIAAWRAQRAKRGALEKPQKGKKKEADK